MKSQSTNPKVAIIVPFYNAQKYLKDCLQSCVNQTYQNLEIILVDDGSNDESLEIAKAYFDKDKRISLICKSNGGQGSARNMGIEYISNGFELLPLVEIQAANTIFISKATLKDNALSNSQTHILANSTGGGHNKTFSTTSVDLPTHFPQIKPLDLSINSAMIFSHSPTPPNDVKYIHFLDSDDMLSLDCIEQCVKGIGTGDILWHDVAEIYEDSIPSSVAIPLLESLKLSEQDTERFLTPLELWQDMESFSFVHQGMFDVRLIENLRFCTPLANEDALFGMILFAKAQRIKVASFQGLIYRYHTESVSGHGEGQNIYRKVYPRFMSEIVSTFGNGYDIKHYYFAYSCTYVCLGLLEYINTLPDSKLKDKLIEFLQVRAIYAFAGVSFTSDPKHIRPLLKALEPYMQRVSRGIKLAYYAPWCVKTLRFLNRYRKSLKAHF